MAETNTTININTVLGNQTVKNNYVIYNKNKTTSNASMRLFGIPHQFNGTTDTRVPSINKNIGAKFLENFIHEAPVVYLIPGKPSFLPSSKDKNKNKNMTNMLKGLEQNLSLDKIASLSGGKDGLNEFSRYYGFEPDYLSYIQYVNMIARSFAVSLGIGNIDVSLPGIGKIGPLSKFNYIDYRWTETKHETIVDQALNTDTGSTINRMASAFSLYSKFNDIKDVDVDKLNSEMSKQFPIFDTNGMGYDSVNSVVREETNINDNVSNLIGQYMDFVQFYVDGGGSTNDNFGNDTASSKMDQLIQTGGELFKEIAFITNSGGVPINGVTDGMEDMTAKLLEQFGGKKYGAIDRILSLSGNVIKGENVIIPEYYDKSRFTQSHSIQITLRQVYGNKLSKFFDICLPLSFILALINPHQTTANTNSSPFLVRYIRPGIETCSMGIIESASIDKSTDPDDLDMDGMPMEMKITLNIKDLYSSLDISPTTNPIGFLNNHSLIDYISVNSGVDIINPNVMAKIRRLTNTITGTVEDILPTVGKSISESLSNKIIKQFKLMNYDR